jgi:hypothetical protein
MRLCAWIAACCSAAALALAGCGGSGGGGALVPKFRLGPGDYFASVPAHDPLRQAVAVVFLMPETELAVDVISGKLYAPIERERSTSREPGYHEALIGVMDPQLHNQIFAYREHGIQGWHAWDPRWGRAAAPAPGKLPVWTPPRLVLHAGRPLAVVLADGQHVALETDGRGRVVRLRWATPRGEPLLTRISYAPRATTVSAPAGVVRTYHFDARHLITEVDAPGAAAHAREDTADGLLDSRATERRLAYRLRSGTPERYAAYEVAPNAINENFLDIAATDGYQRYGVPTLADMRKVDESLRKSGVLDVAEAIPVLNDRVEDYVDAKFFEHVTDGFGSAAWSSGSTGSRTEAR